MFDSANLSKPVAKFVGDALREKDRDLYLCSLFAPARVRTAIMALYAFNAEIATTRKALNEPRVGQVRLKWWFDALAGVFAGTPLHHPVLELLADVVSLGLDRSNLESIIEAEAASLDGDGTKDIAARWTLLFQQVLVFLGARDYQTDRAAESAAKAWAALTALRQGWDRAANAADHHNTICSHRAAIAGITGAAVPAFLPMVLTDIYLERIARVGYNMGHPLARRSDPGVMALPRLWWAVKRRHV